MEFAIGITKNGKRHSSSLVHWFLTYTVMESTHDVKFSSVAKRKLLVTKMGSPLAGHEKKCCLVVWDEWIQSAPEQVL